MNKLTCDICGGNLVCEAELYRCEHCGAVYEKSAHSDEEQTLVTVAFEKLRQTRFDEADEAFTDIINKNGNCYEAFWGKLLAKYGVVFVDDIDGKKIPTCFDLIESVTNDALYKSALTLSPPQVSTVYKTLAEKIEKVRAEWAAKASKERPYDIFLCYKESDAENGVERTADSFEANNLYTYLSQKGYRVFFSRESLRDKVAEQYEPYIFGAIQSAPIMIVYGSKSEYFESTWMRNEWMRFIKRIDKGQKPSNGLVVAYENMSAYDLPSRLKSRQCLDASQKTFYPDLLEHIQRVLSSKENTATTSNEHSVEAAAPSKATRLPHAAESAKTSPKRSAIAIGICALTFALSLASLILAAVTITPNTLLINCLTVLSIIMLTVSVAFLAIFIVRLLFGTRLASSNKLGALKFINKACIPLAAVALTLSVALTVPCSILYSNSFYSFQEVNKVKYYCQKADNGVEVATVNFGDSKAIDIPEYIDGQAVVSLAPNLFKDCTSIISVTVPNTVKSIGEGAFSGCSGLTNITLSSQMTFIADSLLSGCINLISVTVPESITEIGSSAFSGCSVLENITVPENVTAIGEYAFSGCSRLKSITLPFAGAENGGTENTHFGYIFGASSSEKQSNFIPPSLTSVKITDTMQIGENAFSGCSGLEQIVIPNTVTSIGKGAFSGCESLTEFTIPEFVSSIGESAFSGCEGLTEITIPGSVTTIGKSAFSDCIGFTSVIIRDGVQSIGESAFAGCRKITTFSIPNSVTSIGMSAFSDCADLRSITLPFVGATDGGTENTHFGYIFGADVHQSQNDALPLLLTTVTVTHASVINAHAFSNCDKLTNINLSNNVTTIDEYAFNSCDGLTDLVLLSGVATIGDYAFSDCTNLTGVTLPESVKTIGEFAFRGCTKLNEMTVPNSVTSIGFSAFSRCNILSKITLPFVGATDGGTENTYFGYIFGADSAISQNSSIPLSLSTVKITNATTLDDNAFYGCNNLTSIDVNQSGLTSIGSYALYNCSNLRSFTLPGRVTTIGEFAFAGCATLSEISMPSSLKSIGDYAFNGCIELKSIELNDALTSIGSSAFGGCTTLESIYIPNSVTAIGSSAFSGCNSLKHASLSTEITAIDNSTFLACSKLATVVIPNKVTSIASSAFKDCSALENIYIPDSVLSIGSSAFEGCSNLDSVGISNSVTSIGEFAFKGCTTIESIVIPDSVTSIGSSAFEGCSSLARITLPYAGETPQGTANTHFGFIFGAINAQSQNEKIPSSLTSVKLTNATAIAPYAFEGCSNLDSVGISNSVTSIGESAFNGCTTLESIVIPDSVTSIGSSAFGGCSSLARITLPFAGETPQGRSNTHFGFIFGAINAQSQNEQIPSSLTSVTVTDATKFENKAFYGCSNLTDVAVLACSDYIDKSTFEGCSALKKLTVPFVGSTSQNNVNTHFGIIFGASFYNDNAAYLPSSLTTVEITDATKISDYAFSDCTNLTDVTIRGNLSSIDTGAFSGCTGLKNVSLPDTVTSIKSYAFNRCSSLTNINLPTGLETIESSAFMGCTSLESIVIPDSVTSIGNSAFNGCSMLESISLPNTLTSISDFLFNGCVKLKSIDIPDSVETIGEHAFQNCAELKRIDIPNNVTVIGYGAFQNCAGLKSIVISIGMTTVGSSAFFGTTPECVYYTGTSEQWDSITINQSNEPLTSAPRYYYSQSPNYDGKHWRYVDGTPAVWSESE